MTSSDGVYCRRSKPAAIASLTTDSAIRKCLFRAEIFRLSATSMAAILLIYMGMALSDRPKISLKRGLITMVVRVNSCRALYSASQVLCAVIGYRFDAQQIGVPLTSIELPAVLFGEKMVPQLLSVEPVS